MLVVEKIGKKVKIRVGSMNNVEWLNKASELMEQLKDYKSDYLF